MKSLWGVGGTQQMLAVLTTKDLMKPKYKPLFKTFGPSGIKITAMKGLVTFVAVNN